MASGCHIEYQGLDYSSGTLSKLASKPPPLLMSPWWWLACSGPPWPCVPNSHPISTLLSDPWLLVTLPAPLTPTAPPELTFSFSLPIVVLWLPAVSGESSPNQAQDPQNLQPYLNIHQHPRPRSRCPGEATKEQNTQSWCDQEIPGCLVASIWEKHKG